MIFFKISNTTPAFAENYGAYLGRVNFAKVKRDNGNFDIFFNSPTLTRNLPGLVIQSVEYAVDTECWGFLINNKKIKATEEFKEHVLFTSMMLL